MVLHKYCITKESDRKTQHPGLSQAATRHATDFDGIPNDSLHRRKPRQEHSRTDKSPSLGMSSSPVARHVIDA